ncbi:MAG: tRNA (adenosine(37)-N6)-threonylcarbamoyltransferase complex ATPase subunit type 1 TsaE [Desulfobacteraceae bacterium]|jgi:tRNA threonylcarbamoyladenosine biosynthesis protein TsaE
MNDEPKSELIIVTSSADETRKLGHDIGKRLDIDTIILLVGELGSGKTCFVQGLAKGLEVPEGYEITSPTYTLVHEYPGRLPLVHIDLYRIHDEYDAEAIGLWEILGQESIVVVEWADRLRDEFWPEAPTLAIEFRIQNHETRLLKLFGYGLQISDLIKEIGTLWDTRICEPKSL